jgi:pimeloyl-ACP methyl ester carboxylesterase
LILLHGSGSNSLGWDGEAEQPSKTHSLYCLDIPGEPGMTEPRRFTARNDFSRWLNEVIELLLSGLSLGGWAALCHAMDYQDKISGVIALAPTGIVKPRFSFLPKVLFYSLRGEKGIRNLMGLMSEGGKRSLNM